MQAIDLARTLAGLWHALSSALSSPQAPGWIQALMALISVPVTWLVASRASAAASSTARQQAEDQAARAEKTAQEQEISHFFHRQIFVTTQILFVRVRVKQAAEKLRGPAAVTADIRVLIEIIDHYIGILCNYYVQDATAMHGKIKSSLPLDNAFALLNTMKSELNSIYENFTPQYPGSSRALAEIGSICRIWADELHQCMIACAAGFDEQPIDIPTGKKPVQSWIEANIGVLEQAVEPFKDSDVASALIKIRQQQADAARPSHTPPPQNFTAPPDAAAP